MEAISASLYVCGCAFLWSFHTPVCCRGVRVLRSHCAAKIGVALPISNSEKTSKELRWMPNYFRILGNFWSFEHSKLDKTMRMKFACFDIKDFIFCSFSSFIFLFPEHQFRIVRSVTPMFRANAVCHWTPYKRRPVSSRSAGVIFYLAFLAVEALAVPALLLALLPRPRPYVLRQ